MSTTVTSPPVISSVNHKNWEGSLQKLISNVFDGNSYTSQLVALNLRMAASCKDQKDELLKQKVQVQNHALELGLKQADEMRAAALARFVGSIVAGVVGIVGSVGGAVKLGKLSSILDGHGKPKTSDVTTNTPAASSASMPSSGPVQGGTKTSNSGAKEVNADEKADKKADKNANKKADKKDTAEDEKTSEDISASANKRPVGAQAEHDHIMNSQNNVYRAQTQTQLVNMIYSQLITQVTDSIKASGEYAGSLHDVEAQVDRTVRDAMLANADNLSEAYGIEKEAFENGLRAAFEARQYSAFSN